MRQIEYSIYFACKRKPLHWARVEELELQPHGNYLTKSDYHLLPTGAELPFATWVHELKALSAIPLTRHAARIDIGIGTEFMVSEFTMPVAAPLVQLFAAAGVGLSLTLMPPFNRQMRYRGMSYNVLAADTLPKKPARRLHAAITRHLHGMSLQPHYQNSNFTRLVAHPLPPGSTVGVCRYIARGGWISLDLPPIFMRRVAAQQSALLLHINLPQSHGEKIVTPLHSAL